MAIHKGRAMRNLTRTQQLVYSEDQRWVGLDLWTGVERARRHRAREREAMKRRLQLVPNSPDWKNLPELSDGSDLDYF